MPTFLAVFVPVLAALAASQAIADEAPAIGSAVPAEMVGLLHPPGENDHFLRPSALRRDTTTGEILVCDPGNNRIVIFDARGFYRFEFELTDRVAIANDLAVDSEGFIYVLGRTSEGRRILRYDFDGLYLDELALPEAVGDLPLRVRSVCCDGQDRLHLLDGDNRRIVTCDRSGAVLGVMPLKIQLDPEAPVEAFIGTITAVGDRLYVPLPRQGVVQVYDLASRSLARRIGHKGNNLGQLNFPVVATETDEGLILVLDKFRFLVLCYSADGRFLGEFGGKGMQAGWFYHPSLLTAGGDGHVYVGQIYENLVQVCRLPEFIRAANLRGRSMDKEARGS